MAIAALRSADSPLTSGNSIEFSYDSIKEAFPDVDAGIAPFGVNCLFMIRHPKLRTKGGIILDPSSRSTEHYNTQVAKVIAIGPLCFKHANKTIDKYGNEAEELVNWPEGPWFKAGDYVRLPKYGGDRFTVPYQRVDYELDPKSGRRESHTTTDEVVFAIHKAKDVLALITGDPLKIKAYID